jgi:hypothetical protein
MKKEPEKKPKKIKESPNHSELAKTIAFLDAMHKRSSKGVKKNEKST